MADGKQQKGPPGLRRINVHEVYEVEYWARKYGCTEDQLRAAVVAVGTWPAAVKAYLDQKRPS